MVTQTTTVEILPANTPVHVWADGRFITEPRRFLWDGGGVKDVRWRSYGRRVAAGDGLRANPRCSAAGCPKGATRWLAAKVTLETIVLCRGRAVYTTLRVKGVSPELAVGVFQLPRGCRVESSNPFMLRAEAFP